MRKKSKFWPLLILVTLVFFGNSIVSSLAYAHEIEGLWTMDSSITDLPIFTLDLFIEDNLVYGRVVEVHEKNGYHHDSVCSACTANKKDRPFKGMVVIWGFRENKNDNNYWPIGKAVDPTSGKIYTAEFNLEKKRQAMNLRIYTGIALFGRTVYLYR